MRLRSSMPRIVSGENSSIADMVHCLFGAEHRVPAWCPVVFCQTATIYALGGCGKAGIPLPVQFVIRRACDSQQKRLVKVAFARVWKCRSKPASAAEIESGSLISSRWYQP